VYTRDNFQCLYCLKKYPVRALTYDHVIPRAAGGKTTWENVVTACKNCNAMKADKSCDESGMWPAKQPFRPKSLPFVSPITNMDEDAVPEEWKAFLDTSPA
jgi:5-methylcytosine-specific restriction endonuclease McrA